MSTNGYVATPTKLELKDISMLFSRRGRRFEALRDVSLQVAPGQFISIVGASGCGKTTLLRIVDGLSKPTRGEVWVDGRAVDRPGPDRGFVFQHDALFPWRTVLDNVIFGLEVQGRPKREARERADVLVRLVGLTGFEQHFPHELSGGMRQRANLARALTIDPDVLLMDEPFASLDAQTREIMQSELLRIWRSNRKTVLFVTHQIDEALYLADRVVGVNAVHVILAALLCRERTGEAQEVELPMFETLAQFVLDDHMGGRSFDPPLGPPGYSRLLHRRPFETKDGYVCALVYNDKQWESFFRAIGSVAAKPHLATYSERARNYEEAYASLAAIFKTRTTREWLDLLEANDIPCVRLNQLDDLIDDPHLRAVGFFQEIDHPTEGRLRLTGIPSRWSESRPSVDRPPPRLGEHSVEVLREAGLTPAEIERLIAEGATVDGR